MGRGPMDRGVIVFHHWVSCDDGCATCLICGAHFDDAAIDAGEVSRCTGDTGQVHGYTGEQWCNTCDVPNVEPFCPHVYPECECDYCR